jgi:hypothetical protein
MRRPFEDSLERSAVFERLRVGDASLADEILRGGGDDPGSMKNNMRPESRSIKHLQHVIELQISFLC